VRESLNPTGVAVLLLLALVIDYMSFGPNSIRDRLAFLMGLVAIRAGFNGSQLDAWTVDALSRAIDTLKGMTGGAYIAGAATQAQTKLGKFATISFKDSGMSRINTQLWVMALLLGLLGDLPGGIVGGILNGGIGVLTEIFQPLPNFLFGS
jgi:hypothetical protein